VTPDSPADKAGLVSGDVILQYGDKTITTIASLKSAIAMTKPGTPISLSVLRDQKPITLSITLGTFSEQTVPHNLLGIQVKDIEDEAGVLITNVENESPAAFAGIRKGAIILSINRQPIDNVTDFQNVLENAKEDMPLLLFLQQGKYKQYISIKLK